MLERACTTRMAPGRDIPRNPNRGHAAHPPTTTRQRPSRKRKEIRHVPGNHLNVPHLQQATHILPTARRAAARPAAGDDVSV